MEKVVGTNRLTDTFYVAGKALPYKATLTDCRVQQDGNDISFLLREEKPGKTPKNPRSKGENEGNSNLIWHLDQETNRVK